jgi:hypothetical protein
MARAGANPSAGDLKEFSLMGTEKIKAAADSGLAVAMRMQQAYLQMFTRAWQPWLGSFNSLASASSQGARLAGAALAPIHAAATANARRLGRAKKGT